MVVYYEWVMETMDGDDIVDVDHADTYADAVRRASNGARIGLVRDHDRHDDGDAERSWAYITDGRLPEWFTDAGDAPTIKVPKRFHREVTNHN